MSKPLRVVFMGTPQFAVPCLIELISHPDVAQIVAVYTQPTRPAGRGQKPNEPPIKLEAMRHGLPVIQVENINKDDEPRRIADFMADVIVVVAFAQFLGKAVLNIPRLGCVNVHSSLLPKYRGAAPINYAIWKGEKETGVTTMKLVSKMDAGPILLQSTMPIPDQMSAGELHDQLSIMGGKLLIETLRGLRDGTLQEKQQDETLATYATLISKDMGRINWNCTTREIHNQVRALTPWPGGFTNSTKGILKILRTRPIDKPLSAPLNAVAGELYLGSGSLIVKCSDGWLELETVQLEGKKAVSSSEFLNGIQNKKDFNFIEKGES